MHKSAFLLAAAGCLVAAGPCDIYEIGNTPCVATHSTTRALYNGYSGPLYQVRRGSDGSTIDIFPRTHGGVALSSSQDSFCERTTCLITIIYDQSGHGNDLTQAPPGGAAQGPEAGGYDFLASAVGAPVTLNGQKAYGVFISPFTGYRNDQPNGTAVGDEPEGMYAVFDGTHYNTGCCFDYGNAETNNLDEGNGLMEAIYFGTGDGSGRGTGAGNGPWIMADLENGLFSGYDPINNMADPSINSRFVTAILKGGIITGRSAEVMERPANGYNPMRKEGAILLGVGGDNSNRAQGTFYEGVMTSGYPTDETENRVQQDIVDAKYGTTSLVSGPRLNVGSSVSFRVTTPCCSTRYISHIGDRIDTQVASTASEGGLKRHASWTVRQGLAQPDCYSFESRDSPGSFIRHSNYELRVNFNDNSNIFAEDATFCTERGFNGQGHTVRSWSYPARYWRHYKSEGYIASNGSPFEFDNAAHFHDDVSFVVQNSFA